MGLFDLGTSRTRYRVLLSVARTKHYHRSASYRRRLRLAAARRAQKLGRAVYIDGTIRDWQGRALVSALDVIHFDHLKRYPENDRRWGL